MATLTELYNLFFDEDLRGKVHAGLGIVQAEIINGLDTATPYDQTAGAHDLRLKWAAYTVLNADSLGAAMRVLLGANSGLTASQIMGASDAAILLAIRTAADGMAAIYT